MDLEHLSINEVIEVYSEAVKELKKRGILRTRNVVGEIGEFLVMEKYSSNKELPTLTAVPVGTKNINAIDQNGERYSIKSTTGASTGVFYGLEPPGSNIPDKPMFEYVVVCRLNENYELDGIYQLDWPSFLRHKKWHSRMRAWNLTLSEALRKDSLIVYERTQPVKNGKSYLEPCEEEISMKQKKLAKSGNRQDISEQDEDGSSIDCEKDAETGFLAFHEANPMSPSDIPTEKKKITAASWEKTPDINHEIIRARTAERISACLGVHFIKQSQSRYISPDHQRALFIMSSKYSERNREYWYSINDENFPWMELFNECYVAFAMGSENHVLVFPYNRLKEMMKGCLRTKEDEAKGKMAHYHFSFAVEGRKHIYFKKKVPERDFVDVTDALLENWK